MSYETNSEFFGIETLERGITIRLYELAYVSNVFKIMRNYDSAYRNFLSETAPCFNIHKDAHREALFEWLNKWGCRLDRNYKEQFESELKSWYAKCKDLLPPPSLRLPDISDAELEHVLDRVGRAYEELHNTKASPRRNIGATCASKILYALRNEVCPPWDTEMRKKWQYNEDAESYKEFLVTTRNELNQLRVECQKHGFDIVVLPQRIYGHQSSLIKLLNEYNFLKARETEEFKIPTVDVIEKWYQWTREYPESDGYHSN